PRRARRRLRPREPRRARLGPGDGRALCRRPDRGGGRGRLPPAGRRRGHRGGRRPPGRDRRRRLRRGGARAGRRGDRIARRRGGAGRPLAALGARGRGARPARDRDPQGPAQRDRPGVPDRGVTAAHRLADTRPGGGGIRAMETPAEHGTLDATPLPALLLSLYRRRASGRLELAREGVTKRVWLRDGVPVLAESNLPSESLGIQLLDAGRITRDDYAKLVAAVRERGCREAAALLAMNLIGPAELFAALKDQVRRRLLDSMGWPRGDWRFDAADAPAPDATKFRC